MATVAAAPDRLLPAEAAGYRPDIEGLRGVAVLLVVAFHCGVDRLTGGFLGVDVFFVVSGYVITRLLLRECETTGKVGLLEFYARRARRLLPAATLVLVATMLAGAVLLAPTELLFTARAARATAIYASNFFFALNAADYFSPDVGVNALLHTWSLGVEEQFYLFWPLLVLLAFRWRRDRRTLALALGTVTLASLAVSVLYTDRLESWGFYLLPTRAWEFGLGALACLVPRGWSATRTATSGALAWLGLGAVVAAGLLLSEQMPIPGSAALLPALGTAALLLAGAEATSGANRWLATSPMQYLGRVSYSWYLWHWPFVVFAQALLPNITSLGKMAAGALSLLAASATFHLLENPVRFAAPLIARPRVSLALGAVAAGVAFGVATLVGRYSVALGERPDLRAITAAAADVGRLSRRDCVSSPETAAVVRCEFGPGDARVRVVLFGDSHAMQWFNAVQRVAEKHSWRLVTFVKSGCPSIDVRPPSHSEAALENCRRWQREALARVRAEKADAVLLANATSHFGGTNWAASHVPYDEGVDKLRDGTRRTLLALADGGAPVFVIRDIPHLPFDVPTCLARTRRHAWYSEGEGCSLVRAKVVSVDVLEAERAVVRSLPNVHYIDLIDRLCDRERCPTIEGSTVMYRDNHHLTASYAETFAPAIDAALIQAAPALTGGST